MRKAFDADNDFLAQFKSNCFYLDDLVLEPINQIKDSKARREARLRAIPSFTKRLIEYQPKAVVALMRGIEPMVRAAMHQAQMSVPFHVVPFPNYKKSQVRFFLGLTCIIPQLPTGNCAGTNDDLEQDRQLKASGEKTSPSLHVQRLVERLRDGDVRALGRAVSLAESGVSEGGGSAEELLAACFPFTGRALRVGITGAPGAGKSTLVDRLARLYREAGKTVGVVAVDPSSPFTGGAILGDRIRFQGFAGDSGFYARSMATRGALGGLARATADVAAVIEASDKDVILIETVGVGQDEVDIVRLADVTVVVLVPGMGDDVQSLKAGVLEIADIFVINKSDREGAERLDTELKASMSLGHSVGDLDWVVPVVRTVASAGSGVSELVKAISDFQNWLGLEGRLAARRAAQWRERILEMVRGELLREVRRSGLGEVELTVLASLVAGGVENPYLAVPRLLERIRSSHP